MLRRYLELRKPFTRFAPAPAEDTTFSPAALEACRDLDKQWHQQKNIEEADDSQNHSQIDVGGFLGMEDCTDVTVNPQKLTATQQKLRKNNQQTSKDLEIKFRNYLLLFNLIFLMFSMLCALAESSHIESSRQPKQLELKARSTFLHQAEIK